MSVCEIIPNLWLGNVKIAQTLTFYTENKINCVINCSKDLPFFDDKSKNIRISVHDNLEKSEILKLYDYFDNCSDFINQHLKENYKILVHCYAGKQRSASIISCYLMKYGNMSLKESIESIKSKRSIAFTPEINFIKSLLRFEKDLLNR